jgi:hypothetical protein
MSELGGADGSGSAGGAGGGWIAGGSGGRSGAGGAAGTGGGFGVGGNVGGGAGGFIGGFGLGGSNGSSGAGGAPAAVSCVVYGWQPANGGGCTKEVSPGAFQYGVKDGHSCGICSVPSRPAGVPDCIFGATNSLCVASCDECTFQ